MTCNFIKKETRFPVDILKSLNKTFCGTPLVAASENGFKKFIRISTGDFTRSNLYDLTNLNVEIAKLWQLSALKCV